MFVPQIGRGCHFGEPFLGKDLSKKKMGKIFFKIFDAKHQMEKIHSRWLYPGSVRTLAGGGSGPSLVQEGGGVRGTPQPPCTLSSNRTLLGLWLRWGSSGLGLGPAPNRDTQTVFRNLLTSLCHTGDPSKNVRLLNTASQSSEMRRRFLSSKKSCMADNSKYSHVCMICVHDILQTKM